MMKSARVGYTKMIGALIAYHVDQDPCPIMMVQPTLPDAKGTSKEEIQPMIRDVPGLLEKFAAFKNSLLHLRFLGGLLQIVAASTASSFRRVSRRVLCSTRSTATRRTSATKATRSRWPSAARSTTGTGRSSPAARRSSPAPAASSSSSRRAISAATTCRARSAATWITSVFRRENADQDGRAVGHFMKWDRPGRIGRALRLQQLRRRDRGEGQARDARARRVARAAPFNGHASFHIWAAYSYSPNATWAQLAAEYEKAANRAGVEQLKVYVNTVLGETWKERATRPDWERLYERREAYDIGTCPPACCSSPPASTSRSTGLVYEVVGWGRGKESWSIDAILRTAAPGGRDGRSARRRRSRSARLLSVSAVRRGVLSADHRRASDAGDHAGRIHGLQVGAATESPESLSRRQGLRARRRGRRRHGPMG
jgi:phage terminase large subunit GpA-like protein